MSFFSFFKKTSDKELSLVLDIASGSVGAAVVLFSNTQNPKIVYSHRTNISIGDKPDSSKIFSQVSSGLKNVLTEISKVSKRLSYQYHGAKIRNVSCVFSSPWYVSTTKNLRLESPYPVVFSKKVISDLIKKEEEDFEKKSGFYATLGESSPFVLERNIIQAKLNGYETSFPYDKEAKLVEASVFMGFTSESMVNMVLSSIHNTIGVKKVDFHSFPFATYLATRDIFSEEENFAFMDIASEVTDLTIVRGATIAGTASFPSGKNLLMRGVMDYMKVSGEVALSFISMHADGTGDEKLRDQINLVISNLEQKWLKFFYQASMAIPGGLSGISKVFLTVDDDVASIFSQFIKKEKNVIGPGLNANMVPIVLDRERLQHFVVFDPTITLIDPFLMLEVVFLNKLVHLESIKKQ